MLCQNCGKQVEFVGNVCPWCHTPKVKSQVIHVYAYIGGLLGGVLGAGAGYVISHGDFSMFGCLLGMCAGIFTGIACAQDEK